jgi:Transposase DDE domain group 1
MTECHSELVYNFPTPSPLVVGFSDLELSSDAGILLARQTEEQVQGADAGFSLPEIVQVCERSNVGYALGFSRNAVLDRKIADLLERARLQHIQTQQKARLFDHVYYAAKSWNKPRRLIGDEGRMAR